MLNTIGRTCHSAGQYHLLAHPALLTCRRLVERRARAPPVARIHRALRRAVATCMQDDFFAPRLPPNRENIGRNSRFATSPVG